MSYVDGFLIPIPKKNLKAYKKMAALGRDTWMKYGALDYKECIADDIKMQGMPPLTKAAGAKKNETVIFAFIVYKNRKHRDAVNKKVMADPRMNDPKVMGGPMPFDMKRAYVSGFEVIVEA